MRLDPNYPPNYPEFRQRQKTVRATGMVWRPPSRLNLARKPVFPYLVGMEVRFSPGVETRLQQVALASGKEAEQLVKDTVARMLEDQARFVAGVQKGMAQADRGELLDHNEVVKRINRLFEP